MLPLLGLEKGSYAWKKCMSEEKQKNTLDLLSSLSIELHFAYSFLLTSRRLQLTLCPLPLTLLRPFHLIPSCVFLVLVRWVLDECSVGDTVLGKTVCFILSVDHLRLELGSGGWEGSTCTILPFPGSRPGGITLCLDGGFSWWWITSLLNTLEAEIFCCQFTGICHPGWLIHLSCIMTGDIYMIFLHVTIRIRREIQSVLSKLVIFYFFFYFLLLRYLSHCLIREFICNTSLLCIHSSPLQLCPVACEFSKIFLSSPGKLLF